MDASAFAIGTHPPLAVEGWGKSIAQVHGPAADRTVQRHPDFLSDEVHAQPRFYGLALRRVARTFTDSLHMHAQTAQR